MNAIIIVLDRSGSMSAIRDDAEGGLNEFVAEQKAKLPGETNLALVQFDTEYETVYDGTLAAAPSFKLQPRGGTALLDSVMKGIALGDSKQPEKCVVLIITDGHENSSHEVTKEQVQKAIDAHKHWEFVFLAASASDFDEARHLQQAGALHVHLGSTMSVEPQSLRSSLAYTSSNVASYMSDTRSDTAYDEGQRRKVDRKHTKPKA